jgi:hypothetical protein
VRNGGVDWLVVAFIVLVLVLFAMIWWSVPVKP